MVSRPIMRRSSRMHVSRLPKLRSASSYRSMCHHSSLSYCSSCMHSIIDCLDGSCGRVKAVVVVVRVLMAASSNGCYKMLVWHVCRCWSKHSPSMTPHNTMHRPTQQHHNKMQSYTVSPPIHSCNSSLMYSTCLACFGSLRHQSHNVSSQALLLRRLLP